MLVSIVRWRWFAPGVLAVVAVVLLGSTLRAASPVARAAGLTVLPGQRAILRAGPGNLHSFVPTVRRHDLAAPATATIDVTYTGFSTEARAAFQAAVDIWATVIDSPVPIKVDAHFEVLGPGILGAAGPHNYVFLPSTGLVYPIALANRLQGSDIIPNEPDIDASFAIERNDWYFGTDGNTPAGQFDFVTVVLHELGHGLGFLSSDRFQEGQGSYGFTSQPIPQVFDTFMVDGNGNITDTSIYPNPSSALGSAYTSEALFFDGPSTRAAAGDAPARLYAPSVFQEGSSISHLDETTYPAGNPDSLMTPRLGFSEAIHDPGQITRGIFADLGWFGLAPPATRTTSPTHTASPTATTAPHTPTTDSTRTTLTATPTTTAAEPNETATPTHTRTPEPTAELLERQLFLPMIQQ